MIASGQLRHRIRVQKATIEDDKAGQPIRTWTNVVQKIPANVQVGSSSEESRGDKRELKTEYKIKIRFRSDITSEMRIIYQAKTLNIDSIFDPEGLNRELLITAHSVES